MIDIKACFIGHRTVENSEKTMALLKETVISLLNEGVTTFIFGSRSAFDDLSLSVVTQLKKEYPFIKRIYVRSSFQHIDKTYEAYLLSSYEETYFPSKLERAGKYSYVERNYEVIDSSTYCIFYYNENYVPTQSRKQNNQLTTSYRKSGTRAAYDYAVKKKKNIINVYRQY